MLIQGERVNYLDVERIVENIFGNSVHAKRKLSLANAALGIISRVLSKLSTYNNDKYVFQ